jgi:hypothetical protein
VTAHRLPVVQARACGECSVCCDYVSIAELNKPARQPCHLLVDGELRCSVHNTETQPPVCRDFQCAWKRGAGTDADRPDRIGAMFSVNDIDGGVFGLALELWPDAIATSASAMLAAVARHTLLPIVISDYASLPPNDKGDRVAMHHSILYRARAMTGPLLDWVAPDVALHTLVKG